MLVSKEVDGIMTTDPRITQQAHSITEMTYREVAELSFWCQSSPSNSDTPLKIAKIPARILNVYKHEFRGTLIKTELADITNVSGVDLPIGCWFDNY